MEQNRNFGFDILRVLACYLVVQVHAGEFFYIGANGAVLSGNDPFWVGIINSLCRSSVPLFVMLSGFFLLPIKEDLGIFYKKRFTRVAIPFIIWCVVYALYWTLKGQTNWTQAAINIFHIPVNFGTDVGHLWYIYMLIGLYLIAPVISPWIATASRKNFELYLAIWAVSLSVPYIHLIFPKILGECFWNHTPLLYYFSGFLGYMILATYIRKFMSEQKSWHKPLGLSLIVIGYAITAGGFISLLDSTYCWDLELTWQFESFNVAMMAFGIFLLFKNVSISNSTSFVGKSIADISRLSYGIYLVHIIVLNFYYGIFNSIFDTVLIKIPLIASSTFITSYFIIKMLSFLPKSKFITG